MPNKPYCDIERCTMVLIVAILTNCYCFGQSWIPNAIGLTPTKHRTINIINYDSAYVIYDNIKYSIDTMNTTEDSGLFHVYYISRNYDSERYCVIGVETLEFPYKSYLIITNKGDICPEGREICIDSCYFMHIRELYSIKEPLTPPIENQKTNRAEVELIDDMNDRYFIVRGGRKDYIRCLSLHKNISISNNVCGLHYISSH